MFRSDRMVFCNMFLQPDAAFAALYEFGNTGLVQFVDMCPYTPLHSKNFIAEVCRLAEVERKLRFVETEIHRDDIPIPAPLKIGKPLPVLELVRTENMVEGWEKDILDIAANQTSLKIDLLEMKEMRYVLSNIGPMLGNTEFGLQRILAQHKYGGNAASRLYVMTGVVKRTRSFPFQLMLWRISRGNIYYRQANYDEVLEDPYTGAEIRKVAFLTFCQGEVLAARMQKIFAGFRVNIYPCPETNEERLVVLRNVEDRVIDLEEVLHKAIYFRCRSLRMITRKWLKSLIKVRKAKAVYHMLNFFSMDITKNCLIGQCWLPAKDMKRVQDILNTASEKTNASVDSFITIVLTDDEPPTKQRTNKFTYGFQMLINAYGEAKYGEVNPGLFTVVTFPFLFAVMYGDCGHACIMVVFALWMLIYEKEFLKTPSDNEIWNIFFGGRYVILLLGVFSIFTGFVYNDVFSRAMNFGTSMWGNTYSKDELYHNPMIDIDSKSRLSRPYVYGLDPIWTISRNKIMIENSIKMKMSLIIGIIHMLFGIVVSVFNHIHFKKYYLVILQFIPEFTFLFCMFFWLVFLIFYKWVFFYNGHPDPRYTCSCAPQILILFIDMVLYSSTTKKSLGDECEIFLFDSQPTFQFYLVTVSLCMVPILLFGTPLYINHKNKKMKKTLTSQTTSFRKYQTQPTTDEDADLQAKLAKYDQPFGELMIHQGVHTIEFVLSTISHTASYLRLWALSLAHAQLSEMLWVMVLSKLSLQDHSSLGAVKIFVTFPVWACFTVSILVVMEGLSAFLHTLRLHWVEFMSKCFIGGGEPFKPFYFKEILSREHKPEGVCQTIARRHGKQRMVEMQLHNIE